jgi:multiple sugar transport system substrate-binding protein
MSSITRTTRTVTFATVGVLSLGLAACSGGGSEPEQTRSDPITITYLHRLPDGDGMVKVTDIVAEWNEAHPEIQVEATKFDGKAAEMAVKLETDVKANAGPCLAQLGYSEVPEMYVKGLVQDVTEEADKYADHFSAGAFGLMRVGDEVVGLPQDTGPLVYYYNEAAFDQLGIDVPTNLDEFAAAAKTAAAAGKYIAAFTPDEAQYWLSAQAAAAGDTWFGVDGDKWVVDADGAGSQTVAAFWQNLIDSKAVYVGERWGDGFTQALTDGTLLGHVGAAWEAGFLLDPLDGTAAEGQWRVAQLPDYGAGAVTGPDGGSGVAVIDGCDHPAEAVEFLDWFNTQTDALASQGLVVAAKGDVETPEKALRQFGGQDVMAVLGTATQALNPDFPYAPGFSSLATMNQVAANVAAGTAAVGDVFATAQSTAVETLTNLGLPVAR